MRLNDRGEASERGEGRNAGRRERKRGGEGEGGREGYYTFLMISTVFSMIRSTGTSLITSTTCARRPPASGVSGLRRGVVGEWAAGASRSAGLARPRASRRNEACSAGAESGRTIRCEGFPTRCSPPGEIATIRARSRTAAGTIRHLFDDALHDDLADELLLHRAVHGDLRRAGDQSTLARPGETALQGRRDFPGRFTSRTSCTFLSTYWMTGFSCKMAFSTTLGRSTICVQCTFTSSKPTKFTSDCIEKISLQRRPFIMCRGLYLFDNTFFRYVDWGFDWAVNDPLD